MTLAEALRLRGHGVTLLSGPIDVDWLATLVDNSGISWLTCATDAVPLATIVDLEPHWVVVDSYRFASDDVNAVARMLPTMAIIDGDEHGLDVAVYLDQNLGAERSLNDADRQLYGAEFALVRDSVLQQSRPTPWKLRTSRPVVLTVMGGSDSTHASVHVASALSGIAGSIDLCMVVPESDHDEVRVALGPLAQVELIAPTPRLPELLGDADIVISAAGTSAWDICALGIPAVLIAVVDNQQVSLREAVARGLAAGIDAVDDPDAIRRELPAMVDELIGNDDIRRQLSVNSRSTFDGKGKTRVVQHLERGYQQ